MQNTEDRRRLIERYGGRQAGPVGAVLKCAAGVVVLISFAAGPWLLLDPNGAKNETEPPPSKTAKALADPVAESKRVFDERRARYQARLQSPPGHDGIVTGAKAAEDPAGK